MLRFFPCRSAAAAQTYFTRGLAREDYYTQGQEIEGRWCGKAAELLGLIDQGSVAAVERHAFVALTENRRPDTGERLTQRTRSNRTVGYDINFHAPKSVSLLYALHGDERILTAFRESVRQTMQEMETDAATRVRKHGVYDDRRTGNLCWAEFVHLTARPTDSVSGPDPHLHAHCFTFNATYDHDEERWKAGQFRDLVRDAPYLEAAFHARFAGALRDLGYRVERHRTGWDLTGVPRDLVMKFSSRTREIEAFAAERDITDPVAKGRLGAQTRKGKDKDSGIPDLRRGWDDRLTDEERDLMARIAGGGDTPGVPGDGGDPSPVIDAQRAMDWAIDHSFERKSTVPLKRVVAAALKHAAGAVSVEEMWRIVPEQGFLQRTVRGQELVTTRAVLAEEKKFIEFAVEGKGRCEPFADRIERRSGKAWEIQEERLGPDQRAAVDYLLTSKDRVMAIRGAAGTGKTTMMRESVAALRASGSSVVVVAPLAEQARGPDSLRANGFPGADTVAKLLSDPQMQKGLANKQGGGVLWVDEAGLLGAKTLGALFDLAEKHGARVVLSGDERQHKPVERGDALRVLQTMAGIQPAELLTIRRQRGVYREAVEALSVGDVSTGMQKLADLGAFTELDEAADRHAAAAADYVETTAKRRTALVVCPTHAEGRKVANSIRSLQRENGTLRGEDRTIESLRDLGWSEAQRSDPAEYEEGLVVHYRQHARSVFAGDKCEVLGVGENASGHRVVRGRTPRGVEVELPLDAPERFQVYAKGTIDVAVGDRIRLTRDGRTADRRWRLSNRAMFTVTGFTKEGHLMVAGQDKRVRPRVISRSFGHLTHGSVLTSHAAQGKDVDRVIVAMSADSVAASSEEQFYVSVSRGKKDLMVYTDDIANLVDAVERTAARLSASEHAVGSEIDPKMNGTGSLTRDEAIRLAAEIGQRNADAKLKHRQAAIGQSVVGRDRGVPGRGRDAPGRELGRER